MKNITILLPIYKLEEDELVMLREALTSIEDFHNDVKLTIICPKEFEEKFSKFDFGQKLEVKFVYNTTKNTDFSTQVNLGIESCDTEWFSILEIDDEFKKIWLTSMNEYLTEFTNIDVFLPIVRDINEKGEFTSFTNESAWAYGFTEKQGELDLDVLLEFQNYQTSGGLFKTEKIKEIGKFKDNIKLTFTYEFLLRLAHYGAKIMVVPRIGYQHTVLREDSLFWLYKNDEKQKLSEKEVKFWVDTSRKEYFYKNKRDIIYVE